jgi:hypothetical protein
MNIDFDSFITKFRNNSQPVQTLEEWIQIVHSILKLNNDTFLSIELSNIFKGMDACLYCARYNNMSCSKLTELKNLCLEVHIKNRFAQEHSDIYYFSS